MTDQELVNELRASRNNGEIVDAACIERLFVLASDYGEEGKVARKLLTIVKGLLELE